MKNKQLNLAELKSKISGSVLTAESDNYDAARTHWELSIIQRPAIIVIAESALDIAEAVRFAKDNGLKVAVTNTGHGAAQPANDNMLIVVSSLNEVKVDPNNRTATVAAGAKWIDVLEKAQLSGLAPLMGSSSDVGAIGYTMGGGMGWLARKYGLSADNVISYDLVTADGEMVHASNSVNKALFWALNGGGPAFGIIKAMKIKLFPVKTVYAGNLIYPREAAQAVFAHYKEWIGTIEDDWTTSISINNFPPLPTIAEFLRGQSVVMIRGCYTGPVEKGAAIIKSWVDWMEPMANLFGPIPFQAADTISNDPKEPNLAMVTNIIIKDLSDEVIKALIDKAFPAHEPIPLLFTELTHAGGAMARVDNDANAFCQHDAPFVLKLIGHIPTPAARLAFTAVVNGIKDELEPHTSDGVYLNFLTGEGKWQHTQDAFTPEVFRKLINLKKRYDPKNIFCFGLNIPVE